MNRNELWKLYCEKDKEFQKAREKRAIKTIMFFAVVFFLWTYFTEKPTGFNIIGDFFACVVVAVIYFLANAVIFSTLSEASRAEDEALKAIKKRMDEAE